MKKLVINTNLEKNNFVQKITNYVKVNDLDIVREYFLDIPDVDIADVLSNFDDISIIIYVIRVLPTSRAANVFSYLDIQLQEDIINTLSTKENTLILEQLYIDDIINMLEDMPVDIVRKILSITPIKRRDKINNLLKYDNCAGELISVDYVEFLDTETVGQAINKLKERKEISEKTSYYYVINSKRLLVGYFYLSSLFLHNNLNDPISSFMKHNVTSIDVKMSKASLVRSFKKYDLPELPVVNCDHQLIGLITSDDIIDLVEEEVTEDIEKFSGIVHTEQDNYLKTTV